MNRDFSELLSAFAAHNVDYLVIGAHALAAHGHARATKDMDVWVRASPDNASRVFAALTAFGAPLAGVTLDDFANPGTVFQIGVAPVRIDILTEIDGVDFEEAWRERVSAHFGTTPAFVISKRHLVQNKRATGRLQDLADVERLERGDDD